MKYPVPTWLIPLNIFQIQGLCCCARMKASFGNDVFIKSFFCYSARSIYQANMIIIWGALSPKLARIVPSYLEFLASKHVILQVNTCEKLITNQPNLATLNLRCDELDLINKRRILGEARQCLQA